MKLSCRGHDHALTFAYDLFRVTYLIWNHLQACTCVHMHTEDRKHPWLFIVAALRWRHDFPSTIFCIHNVHDKLYCSMNNYRWKCRHFRNVLCHSIILGCPVVDHLTIITRIDNIGKLYGQRLTYLHNLQGGYCMQNYIKPQSRKKYRRNSDFYNSWSTCHPTWRRVRWSISTAHARISREKSFCINYDNYV